MIYFNPVLLTIDVLSEALPPSTVQMPDAEKLLCHVSIKQGSKYCLAQSDIR